MVNGLENVKRMNSRLYSNIISELKSEIEKQARKIVAQMNSIKPIPEIVIDWTWGDAPEGSFTLGKVAGKQYERIAVTIYATASSADYPGGFPALARWFEFGTANRFHKSGKYVGKITANPYFFPVSRANRKSAKAALSRAVTRAVKKTK
ncbi:MAG: hypothetical protein KJ731_01870 [Alphaproteobacteria bacterium]|nr:hypothetical protein [Alphaproteobacteria bacterium]MBU1280262.1 hypothetical protein [Alphaproteobacteria bacterium]MBU1573001.1 hypothetical protein [Alphaproteobacteria bacterium]MBU1827216.1 hypothetical protein [Alphaproteobacteria bacterium]MBU2079960.1 hypothetical protein [Alphaproteobacteria bacterium]